MTNYFIVCFATDQSIQYFINVSHVLHELCWIQFKQCLFNIQCKNSTIYVAYCFWDSDCYITHNVWWNNILKKQQNINVTFINHILIITEKSGHSASPFTTIQHGFVNQNQIHMNIVVPSLRYCIKTWGELWSTERIFSPFKLEPS